jgi:hypothetical protein
VRRIVITLSIGLLMQTLTVTPANAQVENLVLSTPIPASISSNTLVIDLLPKTYSADLRYDGASVCVLSAGASNCDGFFRLDKSPGVVNSKVNSDYYGKRVSVLTVNENKFFFNFESIGKYEIILVKSYSRFVPGRSVRDTFSSEIRIPIEITDVSYGGFDVVDLGAAGIEILPIPVLDCPEKITNAKQTISCKLSYGFDKPDYRIIVEPSEPFSVCAYKIKHTFSECDAKQKPYFSKDIELDFNSVSTVKIPVSKDVDTAIYLRWNNSNIPYDRNKASFKYYFNKPIKYSPVKKGTSSSGRWEKKCKTVTTRIIPQPGELTSSTLNGGGGLPLSTTSQVCENVWVPKR